MRRGLDDLIAVAAKLPWWVALLLAVVSYAVLHPLASVVVDKPVGLGGLVRRTPGRSRQDATSC